VDGIIINLLTIVKCFSKKFQNLLKFLVFPCILAISSYINQVFVVIITTMKKEKELIHHVNYIKPHQDKELFIYEGHYNNFNFEKHVHEEYTISLIEKGAMSAYLKGFNYKLDKTSIITINPDEVHSCGVLNKDGYKHHSLYINPNMLKDILKVNFNSELLTFKDFQFFDQNIYHKLFYLMNQKNILQNSELQWECQTIEILNNILLLNSKVQEQERLPFHAPLIKKAKEYINDNFHKNLTLDEISQEIGISKYHFLRLFKEQTFVSPHTYLMLRKIEKAKQFLRPGLSIVDTTYLCGFNDQSHLNRRFKAITGVTPGIYKKFFN
jgi:AraC-like DNA-binding protein